MSHYKLDNIIKQKIMQKLHFLDSIKKKSEH